MTKRDRRRWRSGKMGRSRKKGRKWRSGRSRTMGRSRCSKSRMMIGNRKREWRRKGGGWEERGE